MLYINPVFIYTINYYFYTDCIKYGTWNKNRIDK